MKVVVLHDGVSEGASPDQHDVLVQAGVVAEALADLGYDPVAVPFSIDLKKVMEELEKIQPAFVFNLVESVEGKGRLICTAPTILDYLKLPYTGAKTEGLFLTSNKLLTKEMLRAAGIPTPAWLSRESFRKNSIMIDDPCIIKSVWEHASIGLDEDSVVLVTDPYQLFQEMEDRCERLGGECFAETYIEGREFNISLLEDNGKPLALPPAEIRFKAYPPGKFRVVGYRAKWDEASFEYHHTPRFFDFPDGDRALLKQLADIAKECWSIFGLRGYARADFRVDEAGSPWVLEVNANPCLSPDAGFVAAAERADLTFNHVVETIIGDSQSCRKVRDER
jgi:D-alanine-D-alanine ligase